MVEAAETAAAAAAAAPTSAVALAALVAAAAATSLEKQQQQLNTARIPWRYSLFRLNRMNGLRVKENRREEEKEKEWNV